MTTTEGYKIILVSGFGNTLEQVIKTHEQAEAFWNAQGIATDRIDPDYPGKDFKGTLDEIEAKKKEATQQGLKVVSVGTSAGGTLVTAERIRASLQDEPLGKGVTICSRADLHNYPTKYPGKYQPAEELESRSPLLAVAAGYVRENKRAVPFAAGNTLCFTAGVADELVPPESSVLPNACIQLLTGVRNHALAVRTVLLTPRYAERIANFVRQG